MAQATLNGQLTDDGGIACEVRFTYGPGALTLSTPWKSQVIGAYSEVVQNLLNNTEYWFRAEAKNVVGTVTGSTLTFMTPVGPAAVAMQPVTNLLNSSATLNAALIYDGGEPCYVWFEYGLSTSYGVKTDPLYPYDTADTFSTNISALGSGLVFHARAAAQNKHGIFYSPDIAFATKNANLYPTTALDPSLHLILV